MKTLTTKTVWRSCVALAGALVVQGVLASTTIYYHNDLAGSPIAATNASGQVIWRESYRPYGERLTNSAASSGNDVWFTSRRQDAETGLVYMGARYYDPVMGRFVSTDPKGFDEANIHSFNRYAYANNNPLRYRDPDGRSARAVWAVAELSFNVATRLGAPTVGEWLSGAAWWLLNESGTDSEAAPPKGSEKKCPNPDGCNGKQDHRDKQGELADAARGAAEEGEQVLENKKIRGYDSNRRPDVQIVDREGRTRQIYEAERKPESARNRAREAEYDRLGIPHETRGLGN